MRILEFLPYLLIPLILAALIGGVAANSRKRERGMDAEHFVLRESGALVVVGILAMLIGMAAIGAWLFTGLRESEPIWAFLVLFLVFFLLGLFSIWAYAARRVVFQGDEVTAYDMLNRVKHSRLQDVVVVYLKQSGYGVMELFAYSREGRLFRADTTNRGYVLVESKLRAMGLPFLPWQGKKHHQSTYSNPYNANPR